MTSSKNIFKVLVAVLFLMVNSGLNHSVLAQNTILQGFYWDVPVDDQAKNGSWYDSISVKLDHFQDLGIEAIWMPPPSKGNWGIYDSGYGVYDHYDLGNYDQIGTTETRYGSFKELKALISNAKQRNIGIIADIVLNHMYSYQTKDLEYNPILAYSPRIYPSYPANDIVWEFQSINTEETSISISAASKDERINWDGYIMIRLSESADQYLDYNNAESFVGNNSYLDKEKTYISKVSEMGGVSFNINLKSNKKYYVKVQLLNKKEISYSFADQQNYIRVYPFSTIKPLTYTSISSKASTLKDVSWNYESFHPSSNKDLAIMIDNELTPNAKIFGHDFDHSYHTTKKQLTDWGIWMIDSIGYSGVRLDFVQGIDRQFISNWIYDVVQMNDKPLFLVAEYFSENKDLLYEWLSNVKRLSGKHDMKIFDFPLKFELTQMCNSNADYDMRRLQTAGMSLDPNYMVKRRNVVTFIENHDTGKEHDKWLTENWTMAYAFTLMFPASTCVYYNHLYQTPYLDMSDHSKKVNIPTSVKNDLEKLLKIRADYIEDAEYIVLSDKKEIFKDIYVACVKTSSDSTLFLVLNNSGEMKEFTINSSLMSNSNTKQIVLKDIFGTNKNEIIVDGSGEATFNVNESKVSIWIDQTTKNYEEGIIDNIANPGISL
ncbi:MAG: hypothetical protein CL663_05400 [Bacteroidetes bacterium]|nr:hypothetical protein [Bacteroidota bacterium]